MLLQEAGLELGLAPEFRAWEALPNELLPYEKAVRDPTDMLEIRYAVRPLGRIEIEYEDPHSSAPEPNHMFPLLFSSLVGRLSGGGHSPTREYSEQQARELFNADWAAAAVFDVVPEFGGGFREALLLALHKNTQADAYVVFLYADYPAVKQLIKANLNSLRFAPATPP